MFSLMIVEIEFHLCEPRVYGWNKNFHLSLNIVISPVNRTLMWFIIAGYP